MMCRMNNADYDSGTRMVFSRCVASAMDAYAHAAGLSDEEAAAVIGRSRQYWGKVTRQKGCFNLDEVAVFCRYLGVDPGEFMTRAYREYAEIFQSRL